jgi:hypothetical protein
VIEEAYGPDGKPLALETRLTTSARAARPRIPAPALRERGLARTLTFNLGRPARVRAWIADLGGRRLADVCDRKLTAGIQEITWDGKAANGLPPAPGTYVFHLEAGTFGYDRRMEVAP